MAKTVIITGANGNLGVAAVKKFLDTGYKVIAVDHMGTHLGFAAAHDNFELKDINLSDETATEDFITEAISLYGRIDGALLLVFLMLAQQTERAGRERLLAYHVCDWLAPTRDLLNDRGMMGDGVIELKKIRGWVEDAGFAGFSEVEIFSAQDWWQRSGEETLATCIERHRSAV